LETVFIPIGRCGIWILDIERGVNPTHLNVDAGTLNLRMTMILCI